MKSKRIKLGKDLRDYRKEQGILQYKIAELAGINRSYLHEIETGKKAASFETLLAIANALGCCLDITYQEKE